MNYTRTRIKVCGITNPQDACVVADCGADAVGLVFYDKSPRAVTITQAHQILISLPPFVSSVGLFVNASAAEVEATLTALPLDLLQFHGEETEDYCMSFSRPYFKALKVNPAMDIAAEVSRYPNAKAILLDAWHPDLAGGTGQKFDWDLLHQLDQEKPLILAGGLNVENVAEAIRTVKPYAVDVSSGVEASPGQKSKDAIKQFVEEVNSV